MECCMFRCRINCFHRMMSSVSSPFSTGKGKSQQSEKNIVHGFHLVKGKSSHPMEDYHVAEFKKIRGHELGLYAIFDGHLGDTVASYLQKNLFESILNEEEFWSDPCRAIVKAYEKTDKAILAHIPELGPGGSTAVTAILIDGKKLMVGNVGDSRAILCQNGQAIQLSVDHEPGTSAERGSIENRGGFVSNMPGDVPRVDGQLAVSRAFGDKNLKLHLRSDPDVKLVEVDSGTEFLILASDGLWKVNLLSFRSFNLINYRGFRDCFLLKKYDRIFFSCFGLGNLLSILNQVMKNQEVVDFIRKTKDPQVAAKQLTTEAVNRESKDDISCIVVSFR